MKELIKQCTLVYPGHEWNGKRIDVLLQRGRIERAGPSIKVDDAKIVEAKGKLLFPSLVDVFCSGGEPGFEDREDFESLCLAAKAGGFGHLFVLPDTNPVTDSKSEATYIAEHGSRFGVRIYPLGAISKALKGEALSEIYDMHQIGVRAFTDGYQPINDVNLMKRALDYSKGIGALIMSFPQDEHLSPGGMVNESVHNTSLGLKSAPTLSESIMVNRDLYLLEYTDAQLHMASISTKSSVDLIQKAKKSGLKLSTGVHLHSLIFSEVELSNFDTSFKVQPHLRENTDRKALIKGLNNGVIDVINSGHRPETIENKDIEFDHASYGMSTLETFLSAYNAHLSNELPWDAFIHAASLAPRALMGLEMPDLEEGSPFDFVLFDPTAEWTYSGDNVKSKGKNSPFAGKVLTGKVMH